MVHIHADGVPKINHSKAACRACSLGKAHSLPFPGHFSRAENIGEVIHSDIMGPLEYSFPDGYKYVSTFMDECSRFLFAGFMHRISVLWETFRLDARKIDDFGRDDQRIIIKRLHSDQAKEYIRLEKTMEGYAEKSFSPPYTPEHNAIAERVNRTMVDSARSTLIQANLPYCLWPFALRHVVFVRNRVPHSTTKKAPFLAIHGKRPSLKNIKVFGCCAYVLRLPRLSKFEP